MSGGKSAAAPRRRQDRPRRRRARRLRSQPSHWLRSLRAPAAVPGIGPKTATALVTSPGILMLRDHDELTSHCSVAPTDSRSSTSIQSTSPQRGDDNPLKNPLMLSCPLSERTTGSQSTATSTGRGDEAQRGTKGDREKEVEGHLRDYARRGPVRSPGRDRRGEPSWKRARRAPRCALPRIGRTLG